MAKANSQVQGVAVQIFGEEYLIAENDAIKVQKIANYVDEKMRQIDDQHPGRIPTMASGGAGCDDDCRRTVEYAW